MDLRRTHLLLPAAGLTSEAIYLAATWRLPWWRYGGAAHSWPELLGDGGGAACLAGVGLVVAAYVCGWRVIRKGRGDRWVVWSFAVVFSGTLLWLVPITYDLYAYLDRAHLWTDLGGNPLLDAPLDFVDPLVLAYPVFYATRPAAYGPAWLLASAPATIGPHDVSTGLFYLKAMAAAAYLASAWLVERILRQIRPAQALEGLYLFAWNPLVLLMSVGDGHNDILMMALALLALWLLLGKRYTLAFGALACSIWIKYVSLVLLPLFVLYVWRRCEGDLRRSRWTRLAPGGLAMLGASVLVFLPFGGGAGISGMVERFIQPINTSAGTGSLFTWGLVAGLLLYALVYGMVAWRFWVGACSFQRLANAGFLAALLAFLLGAARSQSWHLIWPASLAGLSDRRWGWPAIVLLSTTMLVVQVGIEWRVSVVGAFF